MFYSLLGFNYHSNSCWEVCVRDRARCAPIYQTRVAFLLINAFVFKKIFKYDSKADDQSLHFSLKSHAVATFYAAPGTEASTPPSVLYKSLKQGNLLSVIN